MGHNALDMSGSHNLTNRFCYWQGDNGTPYLFSRIDGKDLHTFKDCILLLSIESEGDAPQLCWVGLISELPANLTQLLHTPHTAAIGIYVHLLAGSDECRAEVIANLSSSPSKSLLQFVA